LGPSRGTLEAPHAPALSRTHGSCDDRAAFLKLVGPGRVCDRLPRPLADLFELMGVEYTELDQSPRLLGVSAGLGLASRKPPPASRPPSRHRIVLARLH